MSQTNFFKTILTSMFVLCATGFSSCKSSDDDPNPTGDEKNIIGKWEVKNSGAEYGSFEFTGDKKYIVTQKVSGDASTMKSSQTRSETNYIIIIFGDYSAVNAKDNNYTLDLKQFGTIVINISGSGATITVNGETYDTSKVKEVTTNEQTELLCHTWNIKSEDEEGVIATGTMTFTTSGTYFCRITDYENETTNDTGTWEWKGSKMLYASYTRYWTEYSDGEVTHGTETIYDSMNLIKLTDKEFVFEFDDEGNTVQLIGTR